MVISQSGETADTLAAQREAKQKGSKTLAICNVVGSMITREAAGTIYTHAGPGDRRGFHQGLHLPVDRAVHSGHVPGAGQRTSGRERLALPGAGAAAHSRQARNRALARRAFTKRWAASCTAPPIFCSWAAACISPSRSKAR